MRPIQESRRPNRGAILPWFFRPDRSSLGDQQPEMNKLFTFGGATVGSYVGWIVGLRIGVGTAIVLSSVAALAGVVAGWKLARRFR